MEWNFDLKKKGNVSSKLTEYIFIQITNCFCL